jgi:deoxyribodipyrimidine photo-lyase
MQTHRIRHANARDVNASGRYVLYWMQAFRRLHSNHALDAALRWSRELGKPLVVYEGLKRNYPWTNARNHAIMLDGMRDNAAAAKKLGLAYWPFVETPEHSGRGLVRTLAEDACLVITDDYPAFIVPAHNRVLAKCSVPVHLVDGNSLVPFSLLGAAASAAAHLRHRIHANFAEAWRNRAASEPDIHKEAKSKLEPPFPIWSGVDSVAEVDPSVPPVPGVRGGTVAGRAVLAEFIQKKLPRYAEHRNDPDDPADGAASRLSPYLRHGHLSIQEIAEAVLGDAWTPDEIDSKAKGKRAGFYTRDENTGSFLDEAITWRDTGYHWHFAHNVEHGSGTVSWHSGEETPSFNFETFDFSPLGKRTLEVVLPEWAKASLRKHVGDKREHLYTLEEFEAAATHDELWNAAQRELVRTGRIHNYLRMLWGKKVLEWSKTPSDAYRVLEHLNNKYAIDGRDPNSYTGILWCFGLFDRPWFEREVYGSVRYMTSASTAKKFDLDGYMRYVNGLG